MTEQTAGYGSRAREQPPGWAVGFTLYYSFWSLLIIALDVFVIWALAVHGGKVAT